MNTTAMQLPGSIAMIMHDQSLALRLENIFEHAQSEFAKLEQLIYGM